MTNANWKIGALLFLLLIPGVRAQEPVANVWVVNERAAGNERLARVLPEVQSVKLTERFVELHSGGVSLHYFGMLQSPADHVERIRQLRFRIPRQPEPATGARASVRPDVVGVFINGVPIYNQFEATSFRGQNLWHFDPLAMNDDGTLVAAGRPRALLEHSGSLGVLQNLIADASQHSPIIGYAFDGNPIYGPWTYGIDGKLRRMRSGYRLRQLKRRTHLPDGTALTPAQFGPDVNEEFPLGTFVEDYEFVAGVGDLDPFNGRFAKTPEYPAGTYAYFLTTDATGRLAFPYLLAHQYYGQVSAEDLAEAFRDFAAGNPASSAIPLCHEIVAPIRPNESVLALKTGGAAMQAGQPTRLSFQLRSPRGVPVRFLEYVHEKPLHLLIVSEDLAEFAHVHPELTVGDRYEITHTFAHGGRYHLYADFTPPGEPQRIVSFTLQVEGRNRAAQSLTADTELTKLQNSLRLTLTPKQQLRAGEDLELTFTIRDTVTNKPVANLEPFLGAWAHFVLIDPQHQSFIHAHPLEDADNTKPAQINQVHVHGAETFGPPPEEIRTLVSFPRAGLYKLWAQFQLNGETVIQPFVLSVSEALPKTQAGVQIPADAIPINVGASGFAPAQLKLEANRPIKLAITRNQQPNCANRIVLPSLGISRDLPLGETVIVELPAMKSGELSLTCGMGMYKGLLVVQ
ncbi:MAG: YHYH protein [Acidobacteria bacterium]|nr:YHYH protein [Acidobacteriota bacterium]